MNTRRTLLGALLFQLFVLALPSRGADALEAYVKAADPAYKYTVADRTTVGDFSGAHLKLTSQKWREHTWEHDVRIVRPSKVRNPQIAFLFITGSGSGSRYNEMLAKLAERAGAVAALITSVPNQPLYGGKNEDALIAYTFEQYMKTGDETWPLLFPMVKSAVRGMDAVQEFAQKEHQQKIEKFVVAGASKRGWTTYLSAAVDQRVTAMAPMVIDMLNMKAQTDWALKVYGKQSEQIRDYTDSGLVEQMDHPRMVKLRGWVDPYNYRSRYNIPKLLLLGTNDRYWTVDSMRHYWNDLPEPKFVYQTPNAGHNLGGAKDATETLAAFFQMVADKEELPKMEWKLPAGAGENLHVKVNQKAKSIRLWTAESKDRDFRDDKWTSRELPIKTGSSIADVPTEKPERGYRAYMAEVVLTSSTGHDYKLSTEVKVLPELSK